MATTATSTSAAIDSTGQGATTATPTMSKASITSVDVPLTTIFTPPASCSPRSYTVFTNNGTVSYWRGLHLNMGNAVSCYPPSFSLRQAGGTTMQYSPGVCPSGYHAAELIQSGSAAPATSMCCPSGMSYYANVGCYSVVYVSTTVVVNSFTSIAVSPPFTAWDWQVQAVWQSSDLSIFTPASAPLLVAGVTSVSAARTGTAASLASNASQGSDTNNSSQAGLSGGAIAGIVVGVLVGVLALLALVFFLLRRRRRAKLPPSYTHDAKPAPSHGEKASGAAAPGEQQGMPELATDRERTELPEDALVELQSKAPAAELDGGYYGSSQQAKTPTVAPAGSPINTASPAKGQSHD